MLSKQYIIITDHHCKQSICLLYSLNDVVRELQREMISSRTGVVTVHREIHVMEITDKIQKTNRIVCVHLQQIPLYPHYEDSLCVGETWFSNAGMGAAQSQYSNDKHLPKSLT